MSKRPISNHVRDASVAGTRQGGASFSLQLRLRRLVFMAAWLLLARWTPPQLRRWRAFVLRFFGARIARGVNVYASAKIWYPPFLKMEEGAALGPRVRCYNQAPIHIGAHTIISQDATLCAGSHDYNDPHFQLITRPITIGANVWIAAEAFVGPGVRVGDGAVLGARAVAMFDLEPGCVYTGNPAQIFKNRSLHAATAEAQS